MKKLILIIQNINKYINFYNNNKIIYYNKFKIFKVFKNKNNIMIYFFNIFNKYINKINKIK